MIRCCVGVLLMTLALPAMAAAANMPPSRTKPCPKGQLPLTSTITGHRYCAMPGVSMVGGGAPPVLLPPAPAKKTKP